MRGLLILLMLVSVLVVPASALELAAPEVPETGREWMPDETDSFGDGLLELLENGISLMLPELRQAMRISGKLLAIALFLSVVQGISGPARMVCDLAGVLSVCAVLMGQTNAMIALGMETVEEITTYGKLLLPVMTGAMAAQGGITTSAVLYVGTAMFNAVLSGCITSVLMPGVKLYLAVSMVGCATGEEGLKRMADYLKSSVCWILKTLMMVFTTYLGITGVVSGTTDAAALKAAKVTISSVVPVVGGILSDASEAVLVSAGIAKNTAGIYGILAVLAVFLQPFLRLLSHYLVLKLTGALCAVFGCKATTSLVDGFSTAMGFLLAMTGGSCVMVLVSTVCFLRGVQ